MALDQNDFVELNPGVGGDKMATKQDGIVKAQKVMLVYLVGSDIKENSEIYRLPVNTCPSLDFEYVISKDINTYVDITNPGFNSIGFHLAIPTGGRVQFQGSFDGTNFTPITLRQIGADGFSSAPYVSEDYIGSISALRIIRIKTIKAGSVDGSIAGRLCAAVNTIEGIEHGNPPHNIGNPPIRFGLDRTGEISDVVLYTPTLEVPGQSKKFAITGYACSIAGTGTIRIFDETNSANNWILAFDVKSGITEGTPFNHVFNPPFISSAAGNKVKITITGSAVIKGVMNGYEIESV